jgi:hypothetical protein
MMSDTTGGTAGVTELDAADGAELPFAFVAKTVKVYEVPLVNPVTVNGEEAPVAVKPPGLDVAVKEVAAGPEPEGVNVTVACVLPAVAVPIVGALGTKSPPAPCNPATIAPIIKQPNHKLAKN